jgi:hypothetical protein
MYVGTQMYTYTHTHTHTHIHTHTHMLHRHIALGARGWGEQGEGARERDAVFVAEPLVLRKDHGMLKKVQGLHSVSCV